MLRYRLCLWNCYFKFINCFVPCGCHTTSPAVDLGRLSYGNVQTHAHTTNKSHPNTNNKHHQHMSEFDVCYNLKPLHTKGGNKIKRNNTVVTPIDCVGGSRRVPESKKLLTERKMKLNRSNPSIITAELGRCDSSSPLRRSAPLLDISPSRCASSPLLGSGSRSGRGAVLLPARAPSLPLASAWCCGSFVKQLRKTHHFD